MTALRGDAAPPLTDRYDVYDDVAPHYAIYRRWWLALAGRGAERRLERALRRGLRAGVRVLDAGAGTGAVTEAVLRIEPTAPVVMVDRSAGMLAAAGPVAMPRLRGDVDALAVPGWQVRPGHRGMGARDASGPGRSGAGDAAGARSRWPPARGVQRRPGIGITRSFWRPLERIVAGSFSGRSLPSGDVFHRCTASDRTTAALAPAGFMMLGRCCL